MIYFSKRWEMKRCILDEIDTNEWDNLIQSHQNATPFQSPSYIKNWIKSFSYNCEIFFYEIRQNGHLIGLAPFCLQKGIIKQVEILGTGAIKKFPDGFADRTGILIDKKCPEAMQYLVDNVIKYMPDDTAMLLRYIPKDGQLYNSIKEVCQNQQIKAFSRIASRSLFTQLPSTWGDFILTWSRKRKKTYKEIIRKLEKQGKLEVMLYSGKSYHHNVFNDVLSIDESSWKAKNNSNHLPSIKVQRFVSSLFDELCLKEHASIAILRIDGIPIAYELNFWDKNCVYAYIKAFDNEYAKFSPGTYLTYFVMQEAILRGKTIYDQLRGDESYKKWISPNEQIDMDVLILPTTFFQANLAQGYYIGLPKIKSLVRKKLCDIGLKKSEVNLIDSWRRFS